jgi:hypothetical protein
MLLALGGRILDEKTLRILLRIEDFELARDTVKMHSADDIMVLVNDIIDNGSVDLLQRLLSLFPSDGESRLVQSVFYHAASTWNLDHLGALLFHRFGEDASISDILTECIRHNMTEIAQLVIEQHEDSFSVHDKTKLMRMAAETGRLYVIQALSAIDFDQRIVDGVLPLAAKNGRLDIVEWILDHDGEDDSRQCRTERRDAFLQAVRHSHAEIADHLLASAGVDVHAKHEEALMLACKNGCADMVKVLLKHGADANANDGGPFRLAVRGSHKDVAILLVNSDVNTEKILKLLLKDKHTMKALELMTGVAPSKKSALKPIDIALIAAMVLGVTTVVFGLILIVASRFLPLVENLAGLDESCSIHQKIKYD